MLKRIVLSLSLVVCSAYGQEKIPTTTVEVKSLNLKLEMIQIPSGKVAVTNGKGELKQFDVKQVWMARTELTWDNFGVFVFRGDLTERQKAANIDWKSRPSQVYRHPAVWGFEGYPANGMHSRTAEQYCAWLSNQTGKKFRLPSEAEWAWACRAGGPVVKLDADALKKVAWFKDNSKEEMHPAGKLAANPWGFHDMLGNAAEWVIRDDGVPVVAGGWFDEIAQKVTSETRERNLEAWQNSDCNSPKSVSWLSDGFHIGFRVVMEP